MSKGARRLFAALVLLASLGAAASAWGAQQVHILLYHRVGDARHPSTNVALDAFIQQMKHLAEGGFEVVTTGALESFLREGKPLPERAVVIQFDDGYRSVYENAFPVLKEFGYPFTVFIPTRHLEKEFGDYMSWEMVDEIAAWGAEIGAHSHDHPRLGTRDGLTEAEYAARIDGQLKRCAEILTRQGHAPRWYAYPYGEYNPLIVARTRAAGYALGFAQDPGAVGASTDPFEIPRFAVVGGIADMATFRERLGYSPLGFAERTPGLGELEESAPALYRARLADPGRYRAGEVNLFVSELGRLEATFDPATGVVEAKGGKTLSRRLNRVLISVREKESGRFALGSWMMIKP